MWSLVRQIVARLPPRAVEVLHLAQETTLSNLTRRFEVAWLRGQGPSGQPRSMLVAGDTPAVNWLPGIFFGETPRREIVARLPSWELSAAVAALRPQADLTLVRVDRGTRRLFFGNDYLRIPEWVRIHANMPVDIDAHLRGTGLRWGDVRRVRGQRLTFTVSKDPSDFESFYRDMHVPLTRTRFGEQARFTPAAYWRPHLHQGGVMWIERNGERLGGTFFTVRGNTLRLLLLGIRDGRPSAATKGVSEANYIFAYQLARQNGCSRIDWGTVRPSLHDGVLRYKRKWGVSLSERSGWPFDLLLHWNRREVLDELLSRTSLVFRDGNDLSTLYALATQAQATCADAQEALEWLALDGMRRYVLLAPATWASTVGMPARVVAVDLNQARRPEDLMRR